jgi:3-hydroxyisobutyrate dehydrogenase
LLLQDLGLAQNAATTTQSPTPMGSLAHQLYRTLCVNGYSDKDFAVVFKFLQDMDKK